MENNWIRKFERLRKIRITIISIIGAIVLGIIFYIPYVGYNKLETVENVKVFSTSTVMSVDGNKDNTYTSYTYYVNTDKGVYEISPDGLYASKVFGTLKVDSVYTVTTRGFNFPQLSLHPYIIDAK